jgi:hypothetical protein
MEPNNNDKQTLEASSLMKELSSTPRETIDQAVILKVKEITDHSIKIVKEYIQEKELNELEINLIRSISLFSVKEISTGLPKSETLNELPVNDSQKVFMENVIYFWDQVISKLKVWTP